MNDKHHWIDVIRELFEAVKDGGSPSGDEPGQAGEVLHSRRGLPFEVLTRDGRYPGTAVICHERVLIVQDEDRTQGIVDYADISGILIVDGPVAPYVGAIEAVCGIVRDLAPGDSSGSSRLEEIRQSLRGGDDSRRPKTNAAYRGITEHIVRLAEPVLCEFITAGGKSDPHAAALIDCLKGMAGWDRPPRWGRHLLARVLAKLALAEFASSGDPAGATSLIEEGLVELLTVADSMTGEPLFPSHAEWDDILAVMQRDDVHHALEISRQRIIARQGRAVSGGGDEDDQPGAGALW